MRDYKCDSACEKKRFLHKIRLCKCVMSNFNAHCDPGRMREKH